MDHGKCLCGDVRFRVTEPITHTCACHCVQCRKWTGHYWVSFNVSQDALVIENGVESLAWYPDRTTERGFCVICGTSLFWRRMDPPDGRVAVSAGVMEDGFDPPVTDHIWTSEKGAYYELPPTGARHDRDG